MFKSIRYVTQYVCLSPGSANWSVRHQFNFEYLCFQHYPDHTLHKFNELLYPWYQLNQRELPWRSVSDPYLIWVSETILQQTRVSQGLDYYRRFVNRFPDVNSLAAAHEDELMKVWEGLGYYSRARNMHEAAQNIVRVYKGIFPNQYDEILKLKGVGEYTAAAIASIAFGLPYAVVDGNVSRVMARYFGISEAVNNTAGQKLVREAANELLKSSLKRIHSGIHNQAVMELGALICTPKNPECGICPVAESCHANLKKMTGMLPVKNRNLKRLVKYFNFLVIEYDGGYFIEKRTSSGIWKNLYQFPLVETPSELTDDEIINLPEVKQIIVRSGSSIVNISQVYKHVLTHRDIYARFIYIRTSGVLFTDKNFFKVNKEEISNFAFPVLITNYLRKSGILPDNR